MSRSSLLVASRLFSSQVLGELVRNGRSRALGRVIREGRLDSRFAPATPLGDFLEEVFGQLSRSDVRTEYVYKSALVNKLLLGRHSLATTTYLSEFRIGSSKADVVLVNGAGTVYEIKSDRDRLTRLDQQVGDYQRVFPRVIVFCSDRHIEAVDRLVPNSVGLSVLTKRNQISVVRSAQPTYSKLDSLWILDALREGEARAALRELNVPVPEVPNTELYKVMRDVFEALPSTLLHERVLAVLKSERGLAPLADAVKALPTSVRAFALSLPLGPGELARLRETMQIGLHELIIRGG
jgi:hypothetical protein